MINQIFQEDEPKELNVPLADDMFEDDMSEYVEVEKGLNLSAEQLEEIGKYLSDEIAEAESIRKKVETEWKRNRDDYANVAIRFIAEIIPEARDIPIPHASTKADALRDLITGSLFSTNPSMLATVSDMPAASASKIQKLMQKILDRANLEERCKESSEDAWCTNHAIFRCHFCPETESYEIDCIDPECFIIAGGDRFGIENSILVGHSYEERIADILHRVEEKEYIEYPADTNMSELDPCETTKLVQLFFKMDLKYLKSKGKVRPVTQWYIATFDVERKHVLKITEYTHGQRPWYFSGSYLPCKKNGGFWSKHSLGTFMQGPHMAYNITGNTAIYGGVMRAFPPVVVEGEMTNQTDRLKWGETKSSYGGNVTAPFQQFDPSTLEMLMARQERIGDGVARVSQAAAGQTFNKGMTATEAQIIAEAQGSGISGYVSTFAITLEEMVDYIYRTLKYVGDRVVQGLGLNPSYADPELFSQEVKWQASGRGQYASPSLRMAQLDKIDEMSQDPRLIGKFDPVEIAEARMSLFQIGNQERIFDRNRSTPPPAPIAPEGQIGPYQGGMPAPEPPQPGGPGPVAEDAGAIPPA